MLVCLPVRKSAPTFYPGGKAPASTAARPSAAEPENNAQQFQL
jgi:hypothetical protein